MILSKNQIPRTKNQIPGTKRHGSLEFGAWNLVLGVELAIRKEPLTAAEGLSCNKFGKNAAFSREFSLTIAFPLSTLPPCCGLCPFF
jgi:hypothetical protein